MDVDLSRSPSSELTTPPTAVAPQKSATPSAGGSSAEEDTEESSSDSDSSDSNVSSDEYFDADAELGEYAETVVTSPSVSIPPVEGDPSDIEEDDEYAEQDDTSGMS